MDVLESNLPDLLVSILRRVSRCTTLHHRLHYSHALVSRKWMELSKQAQATFEPKFFTDEILRWRLSEEDLLRQIFQFPNLTRIALYRVESLEKITDLFCSRVNQQSSRSSGSSEPAWGLSQLTELVIRIGCEDVSVAGWDSLFQATPEIRNLEVSFTNTIDGALPALSGLRRLRVKTETLTNIASLHQLRELEIEFPGWGIIPEWGVVPAGVGTLPHLEVLHLACFESRSLLDVLSALHSLKKLHIAKCNVEELPTNFTPSSQLQVFHVVDCCYLSSLPDLSSFPDLRSFVLKNLDIKDIPASLVSLSRLTALTIDKCWNLKSLPEGNWGGLMNLRILDLCTLPELERLPSGVNRLLALEVLRVQNCEKVQDFPEGHWDSLEELQDFPEGYWDSLVNLRIVDLEKTGDQDYPGIVGLSPWRVFWANSALE